MTTIPLKKDSSLPELPETMRMVPLNPDKTLYKAVPFEEQLPKQDPIEDVAPEIIKEINKEPLPQETITQEMINMNHEQRLQQIESILLRIRGSI